MITGQGNGQGGREHGQKCDQLPGGRDIENPEHRKYIAEVWGVAEGSIPHTGLTFIPILEAIHAGKINSPADIFEELRVASKGGPNDYYGITWERIDREMGIFWPCPSLEHPGTPRLYEGGKFAHPDGKAHMHTVECRPAAEEPDVEYPIILTTGRVVSQLLYLFSFDTHTRSQ